MIQEFLQQLEDSDVSEKTIVSYQSSWNRFENWFSYTSPDNEVSAVYATQKDIFNFKKYLLVAGGRGGKPASPATSQLTFVHLNAIFRFFAEKGQIANNPVGTIKKPSKAHRHSKWLTHNEQNLLIHGVRDQEHIREYAIVMTFLQLGLRVHELCDIQLTDISMSKKESHAYIRGTADRHRILPINSELFAVLQKYLNERNSTSPYVFFSKRSTKCSERGIQHIIEKYRKLTGIKHLNCKNLRHTFGHKLIVSGNNLQNIALLMGFYKEDGKPNVELARVYKQNFEKNI